MFIDRAALKAEAKTAIRESKTSPYLTALIFAVISYILDALQTKLTGVEVDYATAMSLLQSGDPSYMLQYTLNHVPGVPAQIIGVLLDVMSMLIGTGFLMCMLLVARRMPHTAANLFDSFALFFKVLWLYILEYAFIFLWSLLFIVPGIVAAYSYRQAIYLLIDNPGMSAMDCLRESKRLMRGRKGELFLLDFSFIGWYILCIIPFVSVYVLPYTDVTYAEFYDALRIPGTGGQEPEEPRYGASSGGKPPWEY